MMLEQEPKATYLAELLGGMAEIALFDDVQVTGLCDNAQAVAPGDLFIAVGGRHTHGLFYLNQALARGAAAVIWEPKRNIVPPVSRTRVPIVAVERLGERLGGIADRFFQRPSRDLTIIGVTGTDGKTSVSHCLAQALSEPNKPCGLIGTLGYGLCDRLNPGAHTTPAALRLHAELASMRAQGVRCAVMEVSSHALDQHRIDGVAMDVAILTNLTRDHFDYHQGLQAYAAAKRRLFQMPNLRQAILNTDDAYGLELAETLEPAINILGYGMGKSPLPAKKMVRATNIESTQAGLRFRVSTPWGRGQINSIRLGRFNVSNLLATLSTLLALGVPLEQALGRVGQSRGAPGRMETHGGGDSPLVVVDYAHTPAALAHVLMALRELCRGRLWCVFGCGGDRDAGKRPIMAQVAERHADKVIVTDDNPRTEPPAVITRDILKGFSNAAAVSVIHDRVEAIGHAVSHTRAGDVVLVAGKGHEQVCIVGVEQRPFSDSQQVETRLRGCVS